MARSCRVASFLLALLLPAVAPAAAQDAPARSAVVRWTYVGSFPFVECRNERGGRSQEMRLDRDELVERGNGYFRSIGWRFNGYINVEGCTGYQIFGVARAGDDRMTLSVENFGDSLIGYLEMRFDGARELQATWRPLGTSAPAVECSLRLTEDTLYAEEDGFFESEFIPFWNSFRDAVQRRDRRGVAAMIRFPIESRPCMASDWYANSGESLGRKGFLAGFDKIFDEETVREITGLDPLQIATFRFDPGIYLEIEGVKPGMLVYRLGYNPGIEFSRFYYFAYVNGAYRMVYCTCAG